MSRFIDKLNWVLGTGLKTMGFRPGQVVSPKPKILLVASLAQANFSDLADYVAGADAGLLHISTLGGIEALKQCSQAVPDIPWGRWLRGVAGGETSLDSIECDFVVFPVDTPLGIFENAQAGQKQAEVGIKGAEVGKVLEVGASLSEGLLGTIDTLSVDAVLVSGGREEGYPLTWQDVMLFRHFADSMTKPLLVPVSLKVTARELQVLWEAGVESVIVGVEASRPPGKLRELREAIDKLAFPSPRRRGKAEALLPRTGGETGSAVGEE